MVVLEVPEYVIDLDHIEGGVIEGTREDVEVVDDVGVGVRIDADAKGTGPLLVVSVVVHTQSGRASISSGPGPNTGRARPFSNGGRPARRPQSALHPVNENGSLGGLYRFEVGRHRTLTHDVAKRPTI